MPTNCLSVFDHFMNLALKALIQKQKVDIDGENGVQISIAAKNIVTQGWSHIMVMDSKQAICYIHFSFFRYYVIYYLIIIINMIKKLELHFLMVLRLN